MQTVSSFFVDNIILVFFFYGLAFFVLGLALTLTRWQTSALYFARAVPFLAAFGYSHGLHEWIEMFQLVYGLSPDAAPSLAVNIIRLTILVGSFLLLFTFGVVLLRGEPATYWQKYGPPALMLGLWAILTLAAGRLSQPTVTEWIILADVLSRYTLAIPAAILGGWALMVQQRSFREHQMSQFGRDLVWCAVALFGYGVIGQLFVAQTILLPFNIFTTINFLNWFGIPVQLFRASMAAVLAFYMLRALRAFSLETQQRLEKANQARLDAQRMALETEHRTALEMERLNEELRLTAHELALLLDLSNLLAEPMTLRDRLLQVLEKIVTSVGFANAGLILLTRRDSKDLYVAASTGFDGLGAAAEGDPYYQQIRDLGRQAVTRKLALCRHLDGQIIVFSLEEALRLQKCRQYQSPTLMVALPLTAQERVIGSVVLASSVDKARHTSLDELRLMVGIGQQLGLSIENARLSRDLQKREKILAELVHQVVGAQEAERRRIARELHDATGQSLTAISLGLRGIEAMIASSKPADLEQIRELQGFGTNALKELRRIIADLRPSQLDDLGLVAALRWYLQAFEKRRGIKAELLLTDDIGRLPSEVETVLFRIVQEAMTNVAKHAAASGVMVALDRLPDQICLMIEDDGQGFDPEKILNNDERQSGWGLLGIQERTALLGGVCKIDSSPGHGTVIWVKVPLTREGAENGLSVG